MEGEGVYLSEDKQKYIRNGVARGFVDSEAKGVKPDEKAYAHFYQRYGKLVTVAMKHGVDLTQYAVATVARAATQDEEALYNTDVGKQPRPFALCAGEFIVPEDFDAPLPDDILDAFKGK